MERIFYRTVGWGGESSVGKGEGRGLDEEERDNAGGSNREVEGGKSGRGERTGK